MPSTGGSGYAAVEKCKLAQITLYLPDSLFLCGVLILYGVILIHCL